MQINERKNTHKWIFKDKNSRNMDNDTHNNKEIRFMQNEQSINVNTYIYTCKKREKKSRNIRNECND